LLWGWRLRRRGRAHRLRRTRDAALLALGVLAAAAWGNFLQFRPGFVHGWDVFHYYIGAKYFQELAYTRLYHCALLVDAADGVPGIGARLVRDLETGQVVRGRAVLPRPTACAEAFSPARWAAFRHDVRWFRDRMEPGRWARMFRDHGYNPTPAWTALGSALAGTGPASWTQIGLLTALDPLLLAGMWAAVWWAFGWRSLCVALIYWGTNDPARFAWTGGAFLRQDWLALSVLGLCLLRRGCPGLAGAALGWAAALRIFPVWILAGVVLRAATEVWAAGSLRPPRAAARVALGAAVALALLAGLGARAGGGWQAWDRFVDNSVRHARSTATNRMGLVALAAYDPERGTRVLQAPPVDGASERAWAEARGDALARRWPWLALAIGGFVAMLAWAVRRQPDWAAAILGVGLIPVTGDLTSYYYAILLVYGLLGDRREGIGAALCALSAAGGLVPAIAPGDDERYAVLGALTVLFVVGATVALARRPPEVGLDPGPASSCPCPGAGAGRPGSRRSSP
jgi:hypothetical protein